MAATCCFNSKKIDSKKITCKNVNYTLHLSKKCYAILISSQI